MSSREDILSRIRNSSRRAEAEPAVIADEAQALVADRQAIQPKPGDPEPVKSFIARATSDQVTAQVERIEGMQNLPDVVRNYLSSLEADLKICLQPLPELQGLDWSGFEQIASLEQDGGVAVTLAEYGLAETGSFMVRSGPQNPFLNNFLPLTQIVVLRVDAVLSSTEELWDRLGIDALRQTRALTLITGTSGTADIEAMNIRGAHGPKNMLIVLIGPRD